MFILAQYFIMYGLNQNKIIEAKNNFVQKRFKCAKIDIECGYDVD